MGERGSGGGGGREGVGEGEGGREGPGGCQVKVSHKSHCVFRKMATWSP